MTMQAEEFDQALSDMREMLAEDGYALSWFVDGSEIVVNIAATAAACPECLVPKTLMSMLVSEALERRNLVMSSSSVRLIYPTD
jgi:hypothetical protein